MSKKYNLTINDKWIVANRGKKNSVNPQKPYAWLVEKERTISGQIEDTAIIFLTNRECPFHCLMCDLWKNTTEIPVPIGAIPDQIEWALTQMPKAEHLKLYNNGNFFDERAIPEVDYKRIADLVSNFKTVIVESHPKLISDKCIRFKDMLKPELQVALGLETVHPEVLQKLNKQMTIEDFRKSINYLLQNKISTRAFTLLKPPFLSEVEGIYWAKKSIDFAFSIGVECCTIIPVRSGNGAMDLLMESGDFSLPDIQSLEIVLEYGIELNSGRIFADTWDLHLFSKCKKCTKQRIDRLTKMNLDQRIANRVICSCI
jgi:radical SAM enzyme (TIGR01210 family)